MNRLTTFILKQYNTGMWLGGFQDLYSKTLGYIGLVNAIFIIPTAWEVWLKDLIHQYFPWFTFWLFACFGILGGLFVSAFIFKIMIPSSVSYRNYMTYKHQDPIRRDIALTRKEIKEFKEEVRKDIKWIKKSIKESK